MDGIRLNDSEALQAHNIDKQKVVEEITRAYAHQIYVDGFFNGDPHPGIYLYLSSYFSSLKKSSYLFSCQPFELSIAQLLPWICYCREFPC